MGVTVRFFASFREAAGRSSVEFDGEKSLAALLDEITERFGERMAAELYRTGTRELRPTVNMLLNGVPLRLPEDLCVRLRDGDTLAIFPPVSGG